MKKLLFLVLLVSTSFCFGSEKNVGWMQNEFADKTIIINFDNLEIITQEPNSYHKPLPNTFDFSQKTYIVRCKKTALYIIYVHDKERLEYALKVVKKISSDMNGCEFKNKLFEAYFNEQ